MSVPSSVCRSLVISQLMSPNLGTDDYSWLGCDIPATTSHRPTFPSDRAQTPIEAVEDSLLVLVNHNMTGLTRATLDELFCRDMEAFSEVFDVTEAIGRPSSCPPLVEANCATLYDR